MRPTPLRYSCAIAFVILATGARLAFDPLLGVSHPLTIYYFAILVTARYCGVGPTLFALALCSLLADFFFIAPRFSLGLHNNLAILDVMLFCAVGLLAVTLSEVGRYKTTKLARVVTKLRQAEPGKDDQAAPFQTTLARIGDGVVVANASARVDTLNPVAERLLGWSAADAEGLPIEEVFRLIDEKTRSKIDVPLPSVLRDGTAFELAGRTLLVARDGSTRPIDDCVAPIRDREGSITGLIIVFRDVTEWRQSERAVAESQERLRLAQEAARMGSWEYDIPSGRVTWSASLEAFHGLEPGTFAGTFDAFLSDIHPEDRESVIRTIHETIEDGRDHFIEYRFLHPDGNQRWVEGRGKLFRDESGNPLRLIGVCLDVTERKRAEEALREADRRKDEFLATLAHELRNPLAPIRTGLQILKHTQGDNPAIEPLRAMMDRQAEQLGTLIDDLMDVSRISLGKIDLRKDVVKLATVVDRAVARALPSIQERGHQLSVSVPDDDERIEADPTRLEQILSNLLDNAARYTDPGGQIHLHAYREGEEIVIRVKDTGIGIAPESLAKIFDMFVQIERRLDRSQGGLGIGLSLVKSLVEIHGGKVTAHSEGPGSGTEFVVRLPSIVGDSDERPDSTEWPETDDRHEHLGRRILVVDDNQDAATSLAKYLTKVAGHQVKVAFDGAEALALARSFRPDFVLLDIGLPGMSGYEVAEKLRALPETGGARLIAVTGWGDERDRHHSQASGIDVHLVKPINPDAIRELLVKLESSQPTVKDRGNEPGQT
jgi:PAS domain S-box-containing protein